MSTIGDFSLNIIIIYRYVFTLGKGEVIPGMDRAMMGMCIGEKRRVVIPPELGFGSRGRERDSIKGDQTLYYVVQLIDIFRPVLGAKWTEEDGLQIEVLYNFTH
uniref:peptidylprolyl isomerase n=1 Tax=Parascaris equorum TaxID=6256 RepID=A0A914RGQ7_PAREQ